MVSIRPLLFSLCILPLVACGDDGGDGGGTPTGEKYKYVANDIQVPQRAADPGMQGLDIDGDGVVDNKLGVAIATLGTTLGDAMLASASVDAAVQDGTIIILADFQTEDFQNAGTAGLQVLLGDNPTPAACTTPADPTTCGQHLTGTASFEIAADSPRDSLLVGPIVNGTFNGGPGTVTLQISLTAGGAPINLDLIGARAQGTGISASGGTFKVGGAVAETQFDAEVLPGIKTAIIDPLVTACGGGAPPTCGCASGSPGALVLTLLDANDDCTISVAEIKENPTIGPLLRSDVEIDGVAAISIGLIAVTTGATFTN